MYGRIIGSKFEFSLSRTNKYQFDVKNYRFEDFYGFHFENMFPWQHGSILNILISKSYLFMLGKSPKVSRKNIFPFQRYLSKTTKEGEKHPPQSPALQIKNSELLNV